MKKPKINWKLIDKVVKGENIDKEIKKLEKEQGWKDA